MLTAEQIKQREGKLTSSRIGILMSGDQDKILRLWHEMLDPDRYPPEDLSDVWPVRLGEVTEGLNLEWYIRKHGQVSRHGEVVIGPFDWMSATLDGWDIERRIPVECKHCGGREPMETIIARYMPQCHWQMMVTGAMECALSVIMAAGEPIVEFIPFDTAYSKELMLRAESFMLAIKSFTPPVPMPVVESPVIPSKEYDFGGSPDWTLWAERWRQSYGAAQTAKEAEKSIKALVPADAKKVYGAGIIVTRNRAGALALREGK